MGDAGSQTVLVDFSAVDRLDLCLELPGPKFLFSPSDSVRPRFIRPDLICPHLICPQSAACLVGKMGFTRT
jgi:hypothetical protein